MPELPEVETVMRGLRVRLDGRRLVKVTQRRANLRFPFPDNFAQRLTGRRVESLSRRAKYILMQLDDGQVLLCHLGMSGRMVIIDAQDLKDGASRWEKHDHVIFETDLGDEIRFNDARRFGAMDLIDGAQLEEHKLLRGIGPEPLSNAFNGPELARRLEGKRSPIKAALLDQKVVAGLGNIYVCEALHIAGLSPKRQAYTVQGQRAEKLVAAIRDVLGRAIEAGGSSLRDYVQADGELGYFQHDWVVYGREGESCRRCAADSGGKNEVPIKRLVQSNRSTFYCARCQR
ncbi:bifunctional DNA-formamidopyrimidine glycosylase/DNA-(apurinic or apyrimidinic site) lyase [Denitrobaculum tricleocarpae]|uniref:Formamidopyrimidine-DNA glycosylase n=1 Tax=Denitrobaculum tricleocarpae TaxID=2591009 RepID=A0A545TGH9_9PROT|nr:bifunctional DNA-formamidopyrimidine glycosylase/DNA-(apurinic or apyrimidinic site) lyase [Denitrobaculum tricleocarpae]TQV76350.1 bifunctional DNA-formamidopyrimidine glycosylase/DNA-(apurinic or apyrimidinic site) lyase [Denitrobaculum tricleocarpae]